ncbi:MAG: hypothetical protein QOI66_2168 [Myxococcales bacterium]|nr:hypothetical protein [Myxococcales bacterium]
MNHDGEKTSMLKWLLVILVFQISAACIGTKICSEVGCRDQASITVHRADWMTLPLALTLEIDGRTVKCAAPPASPASGTPCDDLQVSVAHRELTTCTETRTANAVSLHCEPNGRLVEVITFAGTPQRIVATVKADGADVGPKTFDVTYATVRPNGDGCEPVCRQYAGEWELP